MRAVAWCQRPSIAGLVVRAGIEPATSCFSGRRSYQLSYLTSPGALPVELRHASSWSVATLRSPGALPDRSGTLNCTTTGFEPASPMVGLAGFEPATSCSRSKRANRAALQPDAAPGSCRDHALVTCTIFRSSRFRLLVLWMRGHCACADPRIERESPPWEGWQTHLPSTRRPCTGPCVVLPQVLAAVCARQSPRIALNLPDNPLPYPSQAAVGRTTRRDSQI